MTNIELQAGQKAIAALYAGVKGTDKRIMRRFVKACEESIKEYNADKIMLIEDSGTFKKTERTVELVFPGTTDPTAVEKYNECIKALTELDQDDAGVEIPKHWSLEELDNVDVSNPQIDILIDLGLAYDPEEGETEQPPEEGKGEE